MKEDSKIAYHGYIPGLQQILSQKKNPKVLEIGIDRGVTMFPLVTAMAGYCESFMYMGVDVKVQDSVRLILNYMPPPIPGSCFMMERNSLDILPELVEQQMKFDLILLDGDHNYHTVSKELEHMDALLLPDGLMVIDDYDGKWADRDLWYADREGYEDNQIVTKPVESEKSGVKPAVDEWLAKVGWNSAKMIQGEPLLVSRMQLQGPPTQ